jgi:hypothetical protein
MIHKDVNCEIITSLCIIEQTPLESHCLLSRKQWLSKGVCSTIHKDVKCDIITSLIYPPPPRCRIEIRSDGALLEPRGLETKTC